MADLATSVDFEASNMAPPSDEPERTPTRAPDREYALVGLDHIRFHPLNLRRELRDVEELADSIRQNGLLEPVLLVPDGDSGEEDGQFLLVAGHRRHAACVMARHDPIEAIIRRDLDGDGAHVLAMLTENGPRDDLSPIEEAHGYQLALSLNHLTPAKLARRLGKAKDRINSRVALTRLPEHLQVKVHARQLNLADAEKMVEFADDPDFLDGLLTSAGTRNFDYRVEQERRRREQEARKVALRRQLQSAGAHVIDPPQGYPWQSSEKPVHQYVDPTAEPDQDGTPIPFTPETHAAACHLHAVFIHPYDIEPVYVCRNPGEAGHRSVYERPASTTVPQADDAGGDVAVAEAERLRVEEERRRQVEEEQRRKAEVEQAEAQRREDLEVAARLRHGFLTTLVQRKGAGHVLAVLQLLLAEHFEAWLEDADSEDAEFLAGLIDARMPDSNGDDVDWDEVVADLRVALDTRRRPDGVAGALLAITAHDRESALAQGYGWSNASCRRYVRWLIGQGYEPAGIEQELLDQDPDRD